MEWPKSAQAVIGGRAYAANFWQAIAQLSEGPLAVHAVERAQRDSIAQRLGPRFLYPILFAQA